ncbi:MAG: universal stress protein [Kineosporiaceae bacterium]|nr:universal stress protein [Kineosporiaceae bacterium]
MNPIGRVLVGVDGSPTSLQALRIAHELALRLHRPLVAIRVWDPQNDRRYGVPQELDVTREEAHASLRNAFEEGMGGLPRDVELTCLVVRGEPGPALTRLADQVDDVLVVGRSRHRRANRLFLTGSVDEYCVRHADCAVLTAPAPPLLDAVRGPAALHRWDNLLDA